MTVMTTHLLNTGSLPFICETSGVLSHSVKKYIHQTLLLPSERVWARDYMGIWQLWESLGHETTPPPPPPHVQNPVHTYCYTPGIEKIVPRK